MRQKKQVLVSKEILTKMLGDSNTERKKQIVGRALVAILQRQTDDEKTANSTKFQNGIGFTGADAYSGSVTAKYFLSHKTLEDWQLEKWLENDRILKYHRQLNAVAIAKRG